MLTLDEAVDFAKYPHIRPICLPDPTEDLQEGIDVIVSGWGRIGSGSGQSRESLKGAKLKTVSNKDCQQSYTRYKDTLQDTHICAYGEGLDWRELNLFSFFVAKIKSKFLFFFNRWIRCLPRRQWWPALCHETFTKEEIQ